jgi:adenylate cyclase
MVKFLIKYSQWIIAALGLLIFGLTQTDWVQSSELWQKADGALIDRRYHRRYLANPVNLADTNIVLVGLKSSSLTLSQLNPEEITNSPVLSLMQEPWPWDRRVYAAVLDKLADAGAKVVVFDFVFAGEVEGGGDEVFAGALKKHKDQVVLGTMFQNDKFFQHTKPNERLLTGIEANAVEGMEGYVNLSVDPDGVSRHGNYRTSDDLEYVKAAKYSMSTSNIMFDMDHHPEKFPDNLAHLTALAVEKFQGKVPLPPKERANFVDYVGEKGSYYALPIEEMFVNRIWTNPPFNGGLVFSNKIVVVGPISEIFHDIHTTPFGDMPGPEIQAQMMSALLRGSWLLGTTPTVDMSLALLLTGLALLICLRISNALLKVALLVVLVVVYFKISQYVFTNNKLVLPMLQPLVCLVFVGTFGVVFQFVLEQIERLRYRNVLGRYVSENVAKIVLEDRRSFEESLRGQKKSVTILFSDIRGFTTMTETRDADKLVAQLNEYFGEMVKIIEEKNRGTLQKFIGDAIMAAWGDVYTDGLEADARKAVTAALQMRPALAKLNADWKDNPDRQNLAIGIGVNHGEVIYGNIGSQKRMELTVIGDGVNLAARLESATKQFHSDILIGEKVEALTREHFIFRAVDLMTVKGKTKPVEVFELLSDRSVPPPDWLAKYHEAVQSYRQRQFEAAAAGFKAVALAIGGEDFLCDMYLKRCAEYMQRPPPEDWDGSYTLKEK